MIKPEGKIKYAAIRFGNEIYTAYRHFQVIEKLRSLGFERTKIMYAVNDPWNCGFVTENGVFLTRKQAYSYGVRIGQIGKIIGSVLTSEDLWTNDGTPIFNGVEIPQ